MHTATTAILTMIDGIGYPGYNRETLLHDLEGMISVQRFFSTEEVAARYGVSPKTIEVWRKNKTLEPDLRLGQNLVRYSLKALVDFENRSNPGNKYRG